MSKDKTQTEKQTATARARITHHSVDHLYNFLLGMYPDANQDRYSKEDKSKTYKYVMYVRKSTESSRRQDKSPEQQIAACLKYASIHGLNVSKNDIIEEHCSAKEAGIREKFPIMLDWIKEGKYDGILAWHPDRLSRNMKEAGEIIDLVDKNIIKDLKFASHEFENTPSGKMMLGLMFVMAKQYSDKLSLDVNRGNHGKVQKSAMVFADKHGYIKTDNNRLIPDTEENGRGNFKYIREAFNKKIAGETHAQIAKYLNKSGYQKAFHNKKGVRWEDVNWTETKLSTMFSDPIYAGVHVFGTTSKKKVKDIKVVKLMKDEKSKDGYVFIPAVSVEDFSKINGYDVLNYKQVAKNYGFNKSNHNTIFLNGKIECGKCGANIFPYEKKKKVNGKEKIYMYLNCSTGQKLKGNQKHGHMSANAIIKHVIKEFESFSEDYITNKLYKDYQAQLESEKKNQMTMLTQSLNKLKGEKQSLTAKLANQKSLASSFNDKEKASFYYEQMTETNNELKEVEKTKRELEEEMEKVEKVGITHESFLELFTNLPTTLKKSKNWDDKHKLIDALYSNFVVDKGKVLAGQLKPQFGKLMKVPKKQKISSNRDNDIFLELFNHLTEYGEEIQSTVDKLKATLDIKPI